MKRSRALLGLPALSLLAACAGPVTKVEKASVRTQGRALLSVRTKEAKAEPAKPLLDQQGKPAPGNLQTKSYRRGDVASIESTAPAARPLLTPRATASVEPAKPLTDSNGRPAPGNVTRSDKK